MWSGMDPVTVSACMAPKRCRTIGSGGGTKGLNRYADSYGWVRAGDSAGCAAGQIGDMDNVTHGLAGLLLADITIAAVERRTGRATPRGFRRAAVLLGLVAAEFPDADLLYSGDVLGMGKLGYLLHHRGHTHTVVFAILIALVLWGVLLLLRRESRAAPERGPLLALAMAGTFSHLLLDFTNSYGVHPFWPVDNRWFYGDAIFIIEPWLWVVAIAPLWFGFRSGFGRVVLAAAFVGILAAAWYVDMVGSDVALLLTISSVLWFAFMRVLGTSARLSAAVVAWLVVESVGFAASHSARSHVEAAMHDTRLMDVVLTSAAANPLCQNAIVIELDGSSYIVSTATVAAWPALRSALRCAGGAQALSSRRNASSALGGGLQPSPRALDETIAWRQVWSAAADELRTLAETHCEVAAALEFMRAPIWEQDAGGRIRLSDLRYGSGGGSFADVEFEATPAKCPDFVPGWIPPRQDVLTR